ncbi:YtxH domain-containing protein [Bacillus sp. CGMCC 1.16541]|uniref:YtxH domain-containing protein n=1 Tax=Bacillus sp. CGMCC 1.16541 TaxID=2185143 RepID=UPI000D730830|nr:YtxH domain-containing protein [Bacillus sp. CGMCC 1.16541]
MSRMKSLALGIMVGGTAAAIGALLTTPYSGIEVRRKLKEQKEQIQGTSIDLSEKVTKIKDDIQFVVKEGNTIVKNVAKDVSISLNEFKQEIVPHQESLKHHLEEIEKSLSNLEKHVQTTQVADKETTKKEG